MERGSASDGPSTYLDGQRLSPSLPPPLWGSLSPPGSRSHFYHSETLVDETTLAQRTAAFRQLHGNPRTPARKHRQTKSVGNRSSLSSQPVLVRPSSPESTPPGSGSSSSAIPRPLMDRNATLPAVNDFTIDGILQAIEPDIKGTLEEIARICGRSRLSLANEYDSHMPPQGEIRGTDRTPFDHALLPVEEASSSNERLASEMPMIVGDDSSLDDRRDLESIPHYDLLASLTAVHRHSEGPPSSSWGDESSIRADQDISQRSGLVDDSTLPIHHLNADGLPVRSSQRRSKSSSKWTLPHNRLPTQRIRPGENVIAQPFTSEFLLDARKEGSRTPHDWEPESIDRTTYEAHHTNEDVDFRSQPHMFDDNEAAWNTYSLRQRLANLAIIQEAQSWLSWLNGFNTGLSDAEHRSAETNLRSILERHSAIDGPMSVPDQNHNH